MRRISLLIALIICASGFIAAQSNRITARAQHPSDKSATGQQRAELPLAKRSTKPRLTLQQALKLAEAYIEEEKINVSSYFLREARMIQYGEEKDVSEPRWFFWWVHESGALGDYVEITVSMEGRVSRLPSM
jgi:hypothetical protein